MVQEIRRRPSCVTMTLEMGETTCKNWRNVGDRQDDWSNVCLVAQAGTCWECARWHRGPPQLLIVTHRRSPSAESQRSTTASCRVLSQLWSGLLQHWGQRMGTKAEFEAALQRAREKAKVVAPSRALVPEVTIEAARVRVVRLEAALAALACGTRSRCTDIWCVPDTQC